MGRRLREKKWWRGFGKKGLRRASLEEWVGEVRCARGLKKGELEEASGMCVGDGELWE